MNSVNEFLDRASEQCGFERNGYLEKNIPTSFDKIVVVPIFNDLDSTFITSSLVLNQYKKNNPNKYLIICSWPGHKDLYSYADEVWHPRDRSCILNLSLHTDHMNNESDVYVQFLRSLNNRFDNVLMSDDLKKYYNHGIQEAYWKEFQEIHRHLPQISSASKVKTNFVNELKARSGDKVVIYPSTRVRSYQRGKVVLMKPLKEFWCCLVEKLLDEGITPVIYQNSFTFDLSRDFAERCMYLVSEDISDVLSCMREVGCVLDMYSGISRLAIAARTPFVNVDERARFIGDKDYEIDDLYCENIPKQYIFSFSSFLLTGDPSYWGNSIIDNVVIRLKKFLPSLDRNTWPSANESETIVSYNRVRERKIKRLGTKFIRKY